jgi:hypothetical protein
LVSFVCSAIARLAPGAIGWLAFVVDHALRPRLD